MKYSYPGCQKCLVKMCCHNICKEYRDHIYETYGCEIIKEVLSLEDCEEAITDGMFKERPKVIRIGDKEIKVSIDIRGIA